MSLFTWSLFTEDLWFPEGTACVASKFLCINNRFFSQHTDNGQGTWLGGWGGERYLGGVLNNRSQAQSFWLIRRKRKRQTVSQAVSALSVTQQTQQATIILATAEMSPKPSARGLIMRRTPLRLGLCELQMMAHWLREEACWKFRGTKEVTHGSVLFLGGGSPVSSFQASCLS